MTSADPASQRCYLCEEAYPSGEHSQHYAARHTPRLLLPAGAADPGDAGMDQLLRQSPDGASLAADLIVLLHHGATALATAQEGIQGGAVGDCLRNIDDAVSYLVLARQVLTVAVLEAGRNLLG